MSGSKKEHREEEAPTNAPTRELIGFYKMPENLAEMTDEEIDELAGLIVDEIRAKMGRPPRQ